jgi:hypothetical protein
MLSNPGSDVNYKWFVGIPFLSGFSASVGSSGFSVYDLFANNGVDFNTKLRNAVSYASRTDKIAVNQQLEIFSGGFKLPDWQDNEHVSFGMYQEIDLLAYFPKDYAVLALDGNMPYIGKVFNLGDLNGRGEFISVYHVGYHKKINQKLIVGVRGKIYSSLLNVSSTKNSGYFYTVEGTTSKYDQVISANVYVKTSGFATIKEPNSDKNSSTFENEFFLLGGNLGLGLDLGVTYYPKKSLQFTASLTDIGFINHNKYTENYSMKGSYKHVGITTNFAGSSSSSNFIKAFNDAIPLDTLYSKYRTVRPLKLNSSVQYSFGKGRDSQCSCIGGNDDKYINSVGVQLFVMTAPRAPIAAITAYYRRQIFDSLEVKTTYTVDSYSSRNIGLGLSTTIGKLNFYILADNLLEYQDISKAQSLSFQLGLNIVLPVSSYPD